MLSQNGSEFDEAVFIQSKEEFDQMKKQIDTLQTELQKEKQAKQDIQKLFCNLQKEYENEIKEFNSYKLELEQKVKELENNPIKQYKQASQYIQNLIDDKQQLEIKLQEATYQISKLEEQNSSQIELLSSHAFRKEENSTLKQEQNKVQQQIQRLEEKLNQEKEEYLNQIELKDQEIEKLKQQNCNLETEFQKQVQNLQKLNNDLNQQLQQKTEEKQFNQMAINQNQDNQFVQEYDQDCTFRINQYLSDLQKIICYRIKIIDEKPFEDSMKLRDQLSQHLQISINKLLRLPLEKLYIVLKHEIRNNRIKEGLQQFLNPDQQHIFQEEQLYKQSHRFLKEIRNANEECYIISQNWFREWTRCCEYFKLTGEQRKPGRINADLKTQGNFLFKYIPENLSFNQNLKELEANDYILVKKNIFAIWQEKYGCDVVICKNIQFDGNGKILSSINFRKQQVYLKIVGNQKIGILQVDDECQIKNWIRLLKSAINHNYQINCQNIRLWRHKHYQSDYALKQLIDHSGQFNGELLDENLFVKNYNTDLIIIDLQNQEGQWQYTYLDQKEAAKEEFKYLYDKATKGCGQFNCKKEYCASNPLFAELQLDKATIKQFLLELFKEDNVNWNQVCWSLGCGQKPIKDIAVDTVIQLTALSKYTDSFGASFMLKDDFIIDPNDVSLNIKLIDKINSEITYDILNGWINNLFSNAEESPYLVRCIFIILNLKLYQSIIHKPNVMIKYIPKLSKQNKNLLTQWISQADEKWITYYVDTTLSIITEFIKKEQQKFQQLLNKDDIKFLNSQFEFLQLFYYANNIKKIFNKKKFIIPEITKFYPKDGELLEFIQYKAFKKQEQEKYYFTFCQYLWAIPIDFRYEILGIESRIKQYENQNFLFGLRLVIDRQNVIQSTLDCIAQQSSNLKAQLRVEFKGEQGVDQGGPRRELFSLLMQQLFDLNYGMFVAKNNNTILWFDKNSIQMPVQFELIGVILGLALYNQITLDLKFPPLVFKKLMNEPTTFEDLKELDLDLYKGLNYLNQYEKEDLEDVFALKFCVSEDNWGELQTIDLKLNGRNIPVTQQNKQEYIQLCKEYYLEISIKTQFEYFKKGFQKVVNGLGIQLFNGEELQLLIVGQQNFDISELEQSTEYDGYDKSSTYIKTFWAFIRSLDEEQQRKFLFFSTGSDRVPVGGLKSLKFVIQKHGENTEQLPSAHTCFNVFLLPKYDSDEKLVAKLQIALQNCEGFGLI